MGQAAGAAAAIMCRTGATTETIDVDAIRSHLMQRGVQLEDA
jgi:hypothetical protein